VQVMSTSEFEIKKNEIDTKYSDDQRVVADLTQSEAERARAQTELLQLVRQKGALESDFMKSRNYEAELMKYQTIKAALAAANEQMSELNRYLVFLDDNASSLLAESHLENEFRLTITIAFSILIAVVIIGFFLIAYRERGVRDALFASDSGLQFVALFSLIIAIVLFGVINILEGRELAALLGGLSGYILGTGTLGQRRVSGDRQVDDPSQPSYEVRCAPL
jgi:hypothetical protein